jgi:hypothetical protein
MINEAEAVAIRACITIFEAWRNGRTSYRTEEIPADVPIVSNEDISALEVFEFMTTPPDKYFVYIDETNRIATTWMGEKLGDVRFGRKYRDNFGGTRRAVRITGINGRRYVGTYYTSSGNYARIREARTPFRPSWTFSNPEQPRA